MRSCSLSCDTIGITKFKKTVNNLAKCCLPKNIMRQFVGFQTSATGLHRAIVVQTVLLVLDVIINVTAFYITHAFASSLFSFTIMLMRVVITPEMTPFVIATRRLRTQLMEHDMIHCM